MTFLVKAIAAGLLLAGADTTPTLAFDGGFGSAGDASRGYGAEGYRSGAERSYSGAERFRSGSENVFRSGRRSGDGRRSPVIVFEAPPLGVQGRAGYVSPFGVDNARAGVYPGGFGRPVTGSIVYRGFDGEAPSTASPVRPSGAKVIDVEAERLDNRLIGPSGIDVVYSGGAKIIRLAPNYRLADAQRSARAAMAAEETEASPSVGIEPWTAAWKRYCRRAHPDFDARTGLYGSDDGDPRFCTAQ